MLLMAVLLVVGVVAIIGVAMLGAGLVWTRAAAAPQTTLSGSSWRPVGPIWISVSICGHTPQS